MCRRQHRDQLRAVAPAAVLPLRRLAAGLPHRRVHRRCARPLRRAGRGQRKASRSLPSAPPPSSATLERGATKLGWRAVEFPRVFRYDQPGPRREADDGAHVDPAGGRRRGHRRARLPGASNSSSRGDRVTGALCERTRPDGSTRAGHDRSRPCLRLRRRDPDARAAPAQRLPWPGRAVGSSCTRRSRSRHAFPSPLDHAGVPMHRVTEFAPEPHDRRLGQPQGPHRARARGLRRRLRRRARRLGARVRLLRRDPRRRQSAGWSRCPACARRSCRTG